MQALKRLRILTSAGRTCCRVGVSVHNNILMYDVFSLAPEAWSNDAEAGSIKF